MSEDQRDHDEPSSEPRRQLGDRLGDESNAGPAEQTSGGPDGESSERPAGEPDRGPADHPAEEPTQPLNGWQQQSSTHHGQPPTPTSQQPSGYYGQPPVWPQTAPQQTAPQPLPGPAPYPGYGSYRPMGPVTSQQRSLPGGTWVTLAGVALMVGLIGGLVGASLVDLAEDPGRISRGIDGVSTREAAPLEVDNGSVPAVAQALLPSTVQIIAELGGKEGGATGSGFVLDREGHVVTNNHVVASAADESGTILVIDHAGQRHEASVVGRSPVYDLAVLQVDDISGVEPAALGSSRSLRVGESVVAFGAPLGLSQTVTSGIVSALDRPVTTSGESGDDSSFINAVQTDAAINPGNSGGPLVNLSGEVVGVNSAIATTGGFGIESGNIGVGFAIPIEQVRTTVDQILRDGKAEYPVIGAKVRTGGEGMGVGAEITEVMPDTPASDAGLKKGDVVVAVDGQPVTDGIALIVAIRTHVPGEDVEFTILRGDDEDQITVTLDGEVG